MSNMGDITSERIGYMGNTFIGYEFNPNGTVEPVDIKGLGDLQKIIGGYIEITIGQHNWCLYGNEEGRIDMLPMNEPARRFIAGALKTEPAKVLSMHGSMVLVGIDKDGERTELTDELVSQAFACRMYDEPRVEITTFQQGERST
jgi:hypothetical protein